MTLAISDEHAELARTARAFLSDRNARGSARGAVDGQAALPPFWAELAALGWLGLHVPEHDGGSGYGPLELAIVAEELGRACCPGPFLPTAVVAGAVARHGTEPQRRLLLQGLLEGRTIVGLGLWGDVRRTEHECSGDGGVVLYSDGIEMLALAVGDDLLLLPTDIGGLQLEQRESIDPTRPCALVSCEAIEVAPDVVILGAAASARHLFEILVAAEAAGVADACCQMAAAYASERQAFGRVIGQFQAVKHHCANMLVNQQLAAASAWDVATRSGQAADTARRAALLLAVPAAVENAKLNIQVHGGIGFTWEHDAHLYLRRASALRALTGPLDDVATELAGMLDGQFASAPVELPPDAEAARREAVGFVDRYQAAQPAERVSLLLDEGFLFPHWPPPWGRDAGPVEQLVIEQELQGIPRHAHLGPTWWTLPIVLPTIMTHGRDDQRERWIRPTLEGSVHWCQLFSEPGAGSDLAALSTRAARADGGWIVTGQKVWTSNAKDADLGLALVRTSTETGVKHDGITCMVVTMSVPGVTVRPLRQLTGDAEFNEVFLDDVFVPDADVVGEVGRGWSVARTALGNERVSLGGMAFADLWSLVLELAPAAEACSTAYRAELGRLGAVEHALRAMNARQAARAVAGAGLGVEGGVAKLVAAEQAQRVADLAHRLQGARGVFADDHQGVLAKFYLGTRSMTIAGGTSEIMRNMIGEQILGLPRDPRPRERA